MKKVASRITALFLVALMVLTSGCVVYYRLYKLKQQLAQFEERMDILPQDGPTLSFQKPVLKKGDAEWLTGLTPSFTNTTSSGEDVQFRFEKMGVPEGEEKKISDITLILRYRDDQLHGVTFPPRFYDVLTEDNLIEIFKTLDQARIQKREKKTAWTLDQTKVKIPTLKGLYDYFGHPTRREDHPGEIHLTYTYRLQGEAEEGEPDGVMRYTLWEYNLKLKRFDVRIGRFVVRADISTPEGHVEVKRL